MKPCRPEFEGLDSMAHKPFPAKAHQPVFQYSLILSKSSSSSVTDYTSLSELLRLSVLSYGNIYHTWCFTSKVESSLLFLLNFLDAYDFCHTWCFTCSAVLCWVTRIFGYWDINGRREGRFLCCTERGYLWHFTRVWVIAKLNPGLL